MYKNNALHLFLFSIFTIFTVQTTHGMFNSIANYFVASSKSTYSSSNSSASSSSSTPPPFLEAAPIFEEPPITKPAAQILFAIMEDTNSSAEEKLEHLKQNWDPSKINDQNKKGKTLLFLACEYNNDETIEIVRFLIEQKADLNIQAKNKDTPLIKVLKQDNPEIAQLLIASGANINIQGKGNFVARDYAAASDIHLDVLKQLLVDVDPIKEKELFKRLLKVAKAQNTNENPTTQTSKYLEEKMAPLFELEQKEILFSLLKNILEIDKKIRPIEQALQGLRSQKEHGLEKKIENKENELKKINEQLQNKIKEICIVLEKRPLLLFTENEGETPYNVLKKVDIISTTGKEAVDTLLQQIQSKSDLGLMKLVKYLHLIEQLDTKKDAKKILKEKKKLFHHIKAYCKKHPEAINSQDQSGNTALHYAALLTPDPEYTNLLSDLGANPNIKNLAGSTAKEVNLTKRKFEEEVASKETEELLKNKQPKEEKIEIKQELEPKVETPSQEKTIESTIKEEISTQEEKVEECISEIKEEEEEEEEKEEEAPAYDIINPCNEEEQKEKENQEVSSTLETDVEQKFDEQEPLFTPTKEKEKEEEEEEEEEQSKAKDEIKQTLAQEELEHENKEKEECESEEKIKAQEEIDHYNSNIKKGVASIVGISALCALGYKLKKWYLFYLTLQVERAKDTKGTNYAKLSNTDLMIIAAKECLLPDFFVIWLNKEHLEKKKTEEKDNEEESDQNSTAKSEL